MHRIHNKHGPDPDVGSTVCMHARDGTCRMLREKTFRVPRDETSRMPRDGTGRKPRDETYGKPRDGTGYLPSDGTYGMPRDGTGYKPRDATIRMPRDAASSPEVKRLTGHFYLLLPLPRDTRIRGRTHFRRRKIIPVNRPLQPVLAELCPGMSDPFTHFTPSYSYPLIALSLPSQPS